MSKQCLSGLLLFFISSVCLADNPLVSQVFTADPAARVFNGRVYVLTTHDQDDQTDFSDLHDYYMFSSDDMINWQDHGIVFDARTDTNWANLAFAPDIIQRNGQYYLYFPDGANSIGVAVADSPEGPYTDPLGEPLVDRNTPNADVQWLFDPGVFIDDDGQAYLYFGGGGPGNARVILLNDDMISTSGPAITIDVPDFFEALYMHKRNGVYYLSYSTTSEAGLTIDHMTSDNPTSGFEPRGTVLPNPWENNSNNNHQSIVPFNNQWYIFYHNRAVSNERGGNTNERSINADLLFYNNDGSIQQVNAGPAGVPKLKNVDPFVRNEAETIDNEQGIETEGPPTGTRNLAFIEDGDWVKISNVDFGSGATGFEAGVASDTDGGTIEIVLDDVNNSPIGSLNVGNTGGWQSWQTASTQIDTVTGLHDLFLRFSGGSGFLLNVDWYQFTGESTPPADGGSNTIVVRASGTTGTESITLRVGGNDVQSWTLTTGFLDFTASTDLEGDVTVAFTNDSGDADVQIDYIMVNGETRQAEDQSENTGAWGNDQCGGGSNTEWLHCNGFINFGPISSNNDITIRALGTTGTESITLRVGGEDVQSWTLSTVMADYLATTDLAGDVTVAFTNDNDGDADVQIDFVQVNGETRQAEDQSENTGVWANDQCGGGSNSEWLHCNGFINFGPVSSSGGGGNPSPDFLLGNITTSGQVRSDFMQFWDQITPENEGKWGSVEATRDQYNWGPLDAVYDFSRENNIPFKQHTMVWGSQAPSWINNLSPAEQREEIEEWIRDFCARYPDTEMIDVVNESTPGHAPAGYAQSAFGDDWIIESFQLTRQYCPNAILILNDFNVLSWDTQAFIDMARPAVDAGVVDAIGVQAHGLEDWALEDLRSNLDAVAALGLPIYVSEYDVNEANDQVQLQIMQEQFPMFFNHPAVAGITIWGYVAGETWLPNSGLIQPDGSFRPAMTWLMDFVGR